MIGRCVRSLMIGTTLRSSVLRVYFSNVRIPRSHQNDLLVSSRQNVFRRHDPFLDRVRHTPLQQNRFVCLTHAFRRSKFCMFLAPT